MEKIDKLIDKRLEYLTELVLERISKKQYKKLHPLLDKINRLWHLSLKRFWRKKILN